MGDKWQEDSQKVRTVESNMDILLNISEKNIGKSRNSFQLAMEWVKRRKTLQVHLKFHWLKIWCPKPNRRGRKFVPCVTQVLSLQNGSKSQIFIENKCCKDMWRRLRKKIHKQSRRSTFQERGDRLAAQTMQKPSSPGLDWDWTTCSPALVLV